MARKHHEKSSVDGAGFVPKSEHIKREPKAQITPEQYYTNPSRFTLTPLTPEAAAALQKFFAEWAKPCIPPIGDETSE